MTIFLEGSHINLDTELNIGFGEVTRG